MKNLILAITGVVLIQMSTCGNQKSISSYSSRDQQPSVINQLFRDYAAEHDNISSLYETHKDLNKEKSKSIASWKAYNHFAERYFADVKNYVHHFDTATQEALLAYFDKQEKGYLKSVVKFKKEEGETLTELASLDNDMQMLKLLSSHAQFASVLKEDLPDLDKVIDYKTRIKQLSQEVKKTNSTFNGNPGHTISQN